MVFAVSCVFLKWYLRFLLFSSYIFSSVVLPFALYVLGVSFCPTCTSDNFKGMTVTAVSSVFWSRFIIGAILLYLPPFKAFVESNDALGRFNDYGLGGNSPSSLRPRLEFSESSFDVTFQQQVTQLQHNGKWQKVTNLFFVMSRVDSYVLGCPWWHSVEILEVKTNEKVRFHASQWLQTLAALFVVIKWIWAVNNVPSESWHLIQHEIYKVYIFSVWRYFIVS